MQHKNESYDAPKLSIIEIKTERGILVISDPKFNSPFNGDGEDW